MSLSATITQPGKYLNLSLGLALACSILLLNSPYCLAAATERTIEKMRLEQGIQTYRININKLQEGISQQQEKIESSEQQEHHILDELAQIDHRLQEQLDKLYDLEKQMANQQELIITKETELQKASESKQTVQRCLWHAKENET